MNDVWEVMSKAAALGGFAAVAGIFIALIRTLAPRDRIKMEADGSLRGDLLGRITTLESRVVDLEKMLSQEQANHAAQMQVMRHQLANETASLDSLLDLLEINPNKVLESVTMIKERRARNKLALATEKGAQAGARMAGAAARDGDDG